MKNWKFIKCYLCKKYRLAKVLDKFGICKICNENGKSLKNDDILFENWLKEQNL